jgi:hypothetical protein
MSRMEKILELGRKKYGLDIKFKDKSLLMRALGKALFFNPNFMTNYTTVIGKTVYFPSQKNMESRGELAAVTIAHELVHIADAKEAGMALFTYNYLFPQVIALFSLFVIFSSQLWLLALLFLLPLPAPLRTYYELRGYAVTDAVYYKLTGKFTDIDWLVKQFTSPSYFFMCPFEGYVRTKIQENRELIVAGKLSTKIVFVDEILMCFK